MDFDREYQRAQALVEEALQNAFAGELDSPHRELPEAMRYSLLAGGKRVRPVLALKFRNAKRTWDAAQYRSEERRVGKEC